MGLFDFLFGKKKTTLADADKANDHFIAKNPVAQDDESALMREASKLMTGSRFAEAVEAYAALAEKYPAKKGLYESQVGAGYYFLGEYAKAIDAYTSALHNGGDKNMMDDNIWEAAEALYGQTKDTAPVRAYLELFAGGNHKKKAEKLL